MASGVYPSSSRREVSVSGTGRPGTRSPTVSMDSSRARAKSGATSRSKASESVSGMWKERNRRVIPRAAAFSSRRRQSSKGRPRPGYREIPFANFVILERLLEGIIQWLSG